MRSSTRGTPRSLQVVVLVPILACLLGSVNWFLMMRLPDFTPSAAAEGVLGRPRTQPSLVCEHAAHRSPHRGDASA